jgi:hypothetical protein
MSANNGSHPDPQPEFTPEFTEWMNAGNELFGFSYVGLYCSTQEGDDSGTSEVISITFSRSEEYVDRVGQIKLDH